MKVTDCIECPKCHKKFLKRQNPNGTLDWYCHKCHEGFSTHELVHQWGYDAGDLFGDKSSLYIGEMEQTVPVHSEIQKVWFCEYPDGEPYWYSIVERDDAYQMVNRMFLGVEEIDDCLDLRETEYNALGIGVQ